MFVNLWEQTTKILKKYGKNYWVDVDAVCCNDFQINKRNFFEKAAATNYESGYGKQYIAHDLKLIGKDFWLERDEYDGAEHWCFRTIPIPPEETKVINSLISYHGWESLKEINKKVFTNDD